MSNQDELWEKQMKLEMEKSNLTELQKDEIQEKVKNAKENPDKIREISENSKIKQVNKESEESVKFDKEQDQKLQNAEELLKILEKNNLDNELISDSIDSNKTSKESFQIHTDIAKNNQISQFYTYFLIFLAQLFLNYFLYLSIFELINFIFIILRAVFGYRGIYIFNPDSSISTLYWLENQIYYSNFFRLIIISFLLFINYKIMKTQKFQKAILNLRLK